MAGFCGKCGAPLGKNGKCPHCDKPKHTKANAPEKQNKKEMKAKKKAEKQRKKNEPLTTGQKVKSVLIRILIVVIILAVFACAAIGTLVYFDTIKIPFVNQILISTGIKSGDADAMGTNTTETGDAEDMNQPYKVPYADAQKVLNENGSVTDTTAAQDAKGVLTEAQIWENFDKRGFTQSPIITNYTMEGAYADAAEISKDGSDTHPLYRTHYTAKDGTLWSIMYINGTVMATPLTYQDDEELTNPPLILSESENLISYDNVTNSFYTTKPNEAQMQLKKVDTINAKMLEEYTR